MLWQRMVPWDWQATVATKQKTCRRPVTSAPDLDQEMRIYCSPTRWSAVPIEECRNLDLSLAQ